MSAQQLELLSDRDIVIRKFCHKMKYRGKDRWFIFFQIQINDVLLEKRFYRKIFAVKYIIDNKL